MNNFGFRFMSIYFQFRDYFSPPTKILERVGIIHNAKKAGSCGCAIEVYLTKICLSYIVGDEVAIPNVR
jgi:hypothetical protein